MPFVSVEADTILARMEPNRGYEPAELQAFVSHLSAEGLRQVMHDLWVNRQVERFGYAGWRRHRSATPYESASPSGAARPEPVKPEDLFDHDAFSGLFK